MRNRCLVDAGARCVERLGFVISALSTLTMMNSTARAQETGGVLAEISVTATRRDESVQDVPYNIQAISSQIETHTSCAA